MVTFSLSNVTLRPPAKGRADQSFTDPEWHPHAIR
jgi:hypothetical protein